MLIRLLVFFGLGIDAAINHSTLISILCFATPFAGPVGMIFAIIIGVLFAFTGHYLEAAISILTLLYNLIGNKLILINRHKQII